MKFTAEKIAEILNSITHHIHRPDNSKPLSWSELSPEQKQYSKNAVEKIYAMNEIPSPESLHEIWMNPLLEDRWTIGNYSLVNRTHPCIMDYDSLPDSEKLKDLVWYHNLIVFKDFYDC